jgi:hypothetical protein
MRLTTFPVESNVALPGLTRRLTFALISFAIVRFSVSEKPDAFVGMKLSDEFYFATAGQIYRILVSPQAKKKP